MSAPDVVDEIERHTEEGISLLLQAVLREAFVKSGETDVFDWCDGKTLLELVGLERARLFYQHPEKNLVGGRLDKFGELQNDLNFNHSGLAILVMRKYDIPYSDRENNGYAAAFQLQFKAGDRHSKTPIDPAHWP